MSGENSDLKRVVEDLKRDFENHKNETEKRFSVLEKIVDKLKDIIDSLKETALKHTIAIQGIQDSLGEIKGDTKWLRRTITGSLIGFGIGALIAAVKFAPK